jgi:hypothetical protein
MSRYLTIKEEIVNEVMNLSQIPQNGIQKINK